MPVATALASAGAYWTIPLERSARPTQVAVVVSAARQQQAAEAFVRFLTRPDIADLLAGSGFTTGRALVEAR